ncbi:lipid droplet-associated hydrolase [Polypterus senegalus]|uniref:lipid droplet-associated hydrolase n=1 Tax=Polypterus senegalus TaxID=55291 RepID=UPI0019666D29|nr:lipid droplet-associated hydrolase [Polypterus senegalus]
METLSSEGRMESLKEHIYCCNAATEVLKFGQSNLLHASGCEESSSVLFLIIPGNPGIVGFYKTFMQVIYQSFDKKYPVWAVSHAGHCVPPDVMDMKEDTNEAKLEDVFGLNGQVEHKLAFLKQYVPREVKLVLVGHSIGCYIILEIMKRDPLLQVLKSVLLFPTIERMAQSPQGKLMTPMLCRLRYAMYVPIYLLSFLPERVKASMVRLLLHRLQTLDESCVSATINLFSVDCTANAMYMGSQEMVQVMDRDNATIQENQEKLANAMYMGSQEMVQVMDRDNATIQENQEKLIFYYGENDNWCPVQYYEEIKRDFPKADIRLCNKGIRHAFVLDAGRDVALMMTEWLQKVLHSL